MLLRLQGHHAPAEARCHLCRIRLFHGGRLLQRIRWRRGQGEDEVDVHRVCTPIGLKIEAQTPQEIAVSILAEIILNKNKHRYTTVYDHKLIEAINTSNQKAVLATIIKKHGSTPRDIGVMMLVQEDGTVLCLDYDTQEIKQSNKKLTKKKSLTD